MATVTPRIVIVGCGPGSPEYLTGAARRAVMRADVMLGSNRLLDLFPESPAQRIAINGAPEPAIECINTQRAQGRRIVVLVSGDAGLFSLGRHVVEHFSRLQCDVIPGVSSVQVAFARLGLDWSGAQIVSMHGRTPTVSPEELLRLDKFAALTGGREALRWTARLAGLLRATHVGFLCENLTLPQEQIREVTAEQLDTIEPASLAVVLLVRKALLATGKE